MTDAEIISALGMNDTSEEYKAKMLEKINRVVELRLMGLVDEMLTDEQRKDFDNVASENPDNTMKWLSENIVDLDKLYDSALKDYIDELNKKGDLFAQANQ